jgi:hypothetical protein
MAAPSLAPIPPEHPELDPGVFRRHGLIAGLLGAAVLAVWFLVLDLLDGRPLATPTFLGQAMLAGGAGGETVQTVVPSLRQTVLFTMVHALVFVAIGMVVAEFLRMFDLVHSKAFTVVLLFGAICLAFAAFGVIFAAVGPDRISIQHAFLANLLAALAMAGYLARALGAADRT